MEAQKEKLLEGFMNFGKLTKEKAETIWKLIEPFAAYGFNKAHAACYADFSQRVYPGTTSRP